MKMLFIHKNRTAILCVAVAVVYFFSFNNKKYEKCKCVYNGTTWKLNKRQK
jgi:hypothetical protein